MDELNLCIQWRAQNFPMVNFTNFLWHLFMVTTATTRRLCVFRQQVEQIICSKNKPKKICYILHLTGTHRLFCLTYTIFIALNEKKTAASLFWILCALLPIKKGQIKSHRSSHRIARSANQRNLCQIHLIFFSSGFSSLFEWLKHWLCLLW